MSANKHELYSQQDVETGKLSIITPEIQELSRGFPGEGEELLCNISKYVQSLKSAETEVIDLSRTAEEIMNSGYEQGCHERALVIATLMRARGYPTTCILAFRRDDLEDYDGERNVRRRMHVFLRVTTPDGEKLSGTNGKIINAIPETYVFGKEGLDADDIGLKKPDDYQQLFLATREQLENII